MKRNSRIKTKIVQITVIFTLLCSTLAVLVFDPFDWIRDPEPEILPILTQETISGETVEIHRLGSVAKIDVKTSGEGDRFSFRTYLYDLTENRLLCTKYFPEGNWVTGQTKYGFYCVDSDQNRLYVFSKEGTCTKDTAFAVGKDPVTLCAMSTDESYFVYSNPTGNVLTVCYLVSNVGQEVTLTNPLQEFLGFFGENLYAEGIDSSIVEIQIPEGTDTVLHREPRLSVLSPALSVGESQGNYVIASRSVIRFAKAAHPGDRILSPGENGFFAVERKDNGETVRFYHTKENRIYTIEIPGSVAAVCDAANGKILIAKNEADGRKSFAFYTPTRSEHLELSVQEVFHTTEETEEPPEYSSYLIQNVPTLNQHPEYPTGCEITATTMALRYFGDKTTVLNLIQNYLPKSNQFYTKDGVYYGPDPYEVFVGDPRNSGSFGCMAPVIEKTLVSYLGSSECVKNTTGTDLDTLCRTYINRDIPVILWATVKMLPVVPSRSWTLENGTYYTFPGNEHCLLLIGYDEEYYYFNDPDTGTQEKYEKSLVEDRFLALGCQSVVLIPPIPEPPTTTPTEPPTTTPTEPPATTPTEPPTTTPTEPPATTPTEPPATTPTEPPTTTPTEPPATTPTEPPATTPTEPPATTPTEPPTTTPTEPPATTAAESVS